MFEHKEKISSNDCEAIMRAMRENQHTIMAIAESIHDELANDSTVMDMYDDIEHMNCVLDDMPSMLTVSFDVDTNDNIEMEVQAGDNSYSGPCYFHRFWAVAFFDPTATAESYYEQIVDDLSRNLPW